MLKTEVCSAFKTSCMVIRTFYEIFRGHSLLNPYSLVILPTCGLPEICGPSRCTTKLAKFSSFSGKSIVFFHALINKNQERLKDSLTLPQSSPDMVRNASRVLKIGVHLPFNLNFFARPTLQPFNTF